MTSEMGLCVNSLFAVCQPSCPSNLTSAGDAENVYDPHHPARSWRAYETVAFGYFCLPDPSTHLSLDGDAIEPSNPGVRFAKEFFSDVYVAAGPIGLAAFPGAVLFGFAYLTLMRCSCIMGCLVWGSVLLVFGMLGGLGYLALENAAAMEEQVDDAVDDGPADNSKTILATRYLGYAMFALAALWACVICYLCKKIQLAMGVIKEACRAVGHMKGVVLFPILQAHYYYYSKLLLLLLKTTTTTTQNY